MIKALLWDVDGTLADTERDGHRVAFNRAFADLGLSWRWDVARYGELLRVSGGRERLLEDMSTRGDAPGAPAERVALALALHQRKNEHYAALMQAGELPLRPGVRELVEEAASRGLRQAIASTTSRANVQALFARHFGGSAARCFETVVCGEDVRLKKPDPEVYQRVLDGLGLPPLATLAIEDSPAGVAAARAADVPVIVTRSAYFERDAVEAAVAIGPGLHTRAGWSPEASSAGAGRVQLDDLIDWHARMELVSDFG